MQNLILVFATFFFAETSIYSQKPKGGDPGKIGGANAPPTESVVPRKRGLGRVSAALVWPGGHTKGGEAPGLKNSPYLLLVFLFLSNCWRNSLDFVASIARFRENFSQPLDLPRFTPDFFISNLFWFNSEFGGLLGLFLFSFFKHLGLHLAKKKKTY